MKRVLLLGDSIRQNYESYVQHKIENEYDAAVFYPNDNGKFTQFTLRYLQDWYRAVLKNEMPDIIHFNCGLWDVLRLSNEESTFNSLEEYCNNLRRIVDRIGYLSPEAKLIYATTTPVIEPGFSDGAFLATRSNSDIKLFNEKAVEIMNEMSIEVNDLWEVALGLPEEAHSDYVHYDTEIGRKVLGETVAAKIGRYL